MQVETEVKRRKPRNIQSKKRHERNKGNRKYEIWGPREDIIEVTLTSHCICNLAQDPRERARVNRVRLRLWSLRPLHCFTLYIIGKYNSDRDMLDQTLAAVSFNQNWFTELDGTSAQLTCGSHTHRAFGDQPRYTQALSCDWNKWPPTPGM